MPVLLKQDRYLLKYLLGGIKLFKLFKFFLIKVWEYKYHLMKSYCRYFLNNNIPCTLH